MNDQESNDELVVDIESITMLISRAKSGCDKSRGEVLSRLEPFVASTVSRHNHSMLSNKLGSSDIIQRSLLKVFEKFDAFRGESSPQFRAWMKQLIINEIKQLNRNWKRQCRDVGKESSLEAGTFLAADEEPTPSTKVLESEQLNILRSKLKRLNETEQEIVKLRNIDNLSFPEIAQRIGKKSDAVTKIWYRSLVKLQTMMTEDEHDE